MSSYPFPAAAPPQAAATSADPTAVIGRRIGAWVVDLLLYSLIMAFVGPTPISPLAEYVDTNDVAGVDCTVIQEANDVSSCVQIGDRLYFTEGSDAAISFLVFVVVVLGYSLLQGATGRTPGKALFGIKVVDEQGGTPGFGKSILRTVLWVVDLAPWCIPGLVGFVTGLTTKGHRRVGDMAAKTFVVGKNHTGPPQVPGLVTAASGGWPGGGGPGPYGQPGQPGQPWGAAPQPSGPPTAWGGQPQRPTSGAWGAPPAGGPPTPGGPPVAGGQPSGENRPAPPGSWTAPGAASPSAASTPASPAPAAPNDPTVVGGSTSGSASPSDTPSADALSTGAPSSSEAPSSSDAPSSGAPSSSEAPASAGPGPSSAGTHPSPAGGTPAPAAAQPASSGYSPQWDAARGTYIVWEPNRGKWLGWDEAAQEWKPL